MCPHMESRHKKDGSLLLLSLLLDFFNLIIITYNCIDMMMSRTICYPAISCFSVRRATHPVIAKAKNSRVESHSPAHLIGSQIASCVGHAVLVGLLTLGGTCAWLS